MYCQLHDVKQFVTSLQENETACINLTQHVFFDFDGVLVDSTATKTNAYREIFKPYGPEIVEKIVAHHQRHGGISRVEKIKYAHYNIIGDPSPERKIEEDAQKYSELVFEKVINTRWIPGAETFVKKHFRNIPLVKKILTHPDLWDVKHRPPPRANSPPTESFILYDESSSPGADDYIIDADYPVEGYL